MSDLKPISLTELSNTINDQQASQLIETKDVLLNTNPCKRFVAGNHERIQRGIRTLFISSFMRVNNPEAREIFEPKAQRAREETLKNMNKILANFGDKAQQWEDKLLSEGIELKANYSNPVLLQVEIRAPEEHTFWEICQTFDRLMVVMDLLWHKQCQSIESKNEVTAKFAETLNGMANNIERQAISIGRMIGVIRRNGSVDELKPRPYVPNQQLEAEDA